MLLTAWCYHFSTASLGGGFFGLLAWVGLGNIVSTVSGFKRYFKFITIEGSFRNRAVRITIQSLTIILCVHTHTRGMMI